MVCHVSDNEIGGFDLKCDIGSPGIGDTQFYYCTYDNDQYDRDFVALGTPGQTSCPLYNGGGVGTLTALRVTLGGAFTGPC